MSDLTEQSSVTGPERTELNSLATSLLPAWIIASCAILLQLLTNNRYGYFRDELYYLATSDHLAWGYVDFAPLAALILHVSRSILGDSLRAIRFLPALAGGAEILLTGLITRELGGKRFAIFLACLSVLLAPVILNQTTRFSMNPFEPPFWMGCIYFLLLAVNRNRPQWLVGCGILLGVGIENKHSTVFFLASLVGGLLLTSGRRLLTTKWFWIAAGIVILLSLPNFIWQVHHGFATWVDLSNVKRTHKNVELPPLPFIGQQILSLGPTTALVWVAGLGFLLFSKRTKPYRLLGITFLIFFAILMTLHGKDYYLAPIYPMLFAAGGVFWERVQSAGKFVRWIPALVAVLVLTGVIAIPLVVPILPPAEIVPYMEKLGVKPKNNEAATSGDLPQHFGDEFGWPEMVSAVAGAYNALPPAERTKTAILAGNYGEAGAIDFFGARYGLPKAISAHQNYYYWGPRDYTGERVILLQWDPDDAANWCGSVEPGPTLNAPYSMNEEHFTILVCNHFKMPLKDAWPHLKHWN